MSLYDLFVQGIGFVGVALYFVSFQVKSNRGLFFVQFLGCLMFTIQFAFLNALSGCFSLIIIMIRNLLLVAQSRYDWAKWRGWCWVLCIILVIIGYTTWNGPASLLPVIGVLASTIGYFTNNARNIRMSNLLVNSPCSLLYDIIVHSWGGVISESLGILSIVISIYRFGWKALDGDVIE